jgi:hypothetical protein
MFDRHHWRRHPEIPEFVEPGQDIAVLAESRYFDFAPYMEQESSRGTAQANLSRLLRQLLDTAILTRELRFGESVRRPKRFSIAFKIRPCVFGSASSCRAQACGRLTPLVAAVIFKIIFPRMIGIVRISRFSD